MDVSVVVPTFQRSELLGRCLDALLNQDLAGVRYEVIVVDDAASSDTFAQVERYAQASRGNPVVKYYSTTGRCGPATARNIGWRNAEADWIAFTDDDTIPQPDWISSAMKTFRTDMIALSGRVVVPLPLIPTDYERNESNLATAEFVTANCFVLKTALEQIGGFDERFKQAWREDSDLHFQLLKLCESQLKGIAKVENSVVTHPVRPAPWAVSLGQQRKAFYNALLYKKHPGLYRQRIQQYPPFLYYLILTCTVICLTAALIGRWSLALSAAVITFLFIIKFAMRRLKHTCHSFEHVSEMLLTSCAIPYLSIFWRIRGAIHFRVVFL